MADIQIVRGNERVKAFTGQMYNLGAALFGAAFVKVYSDGEASWAAGVWLLGAIGLMYGGYAILGVLQDEG